MLSRAWSPQPVRARVAAARLATLSAKPLSATLGLALVLASCTAAAPPHRGPGPVPAGAADREVLRLVELYLDLSARIDPMLGDSGGPTHWLERWPALEADGLPEREQLARQIHREAQRIPEDQLSATYAADRARLLQLTDHQLVVARRIRQTSKRPRELRTGAAALARELAPYTSSSTAAITALALKTLENQAKTATRSGDWPELAELENTVRISPDVTLLRRQRPYRPLILAWPAVRGVLAGDDRGLRALAATALAELELHGSTTSSTAAITAVTERHLLQAGGEARLDVDRLLLAPGLATRTFLGAVALLELLEREAKVDHAELIRVLFAQGLAPLELLVPVLESRGLL